MAKLVLNDCGILVGMTEATTWTQSVTLDKNAEILDGTTFGSTSRDKVAGLVDVKMSIDGFSSLGADSIEEDSFTHLGSTFPCLVVPETGIDDGDMGFFFEAIGATLNQLGDVGSISPFTIEVEGKSHLIKGTVLKYGTITNGVTNGTAYQVGAVSATEKVYAAFFILEATAVTDLDFSIKSDDAEGFPSGIEKIAWEDQTDRASKWATPVAGAITDDWWRVEMSLTGTSAKVAVVMGIL